MLFVTAQSENLRPLFSLTNAVRELLRHLPREANEVRVMIHLTEAVMIQDTFVEVDGRNLPVSYYLVDAQNPAFSVRLGYAVGNLE